MDTTGSKSVWTWARECERETLEAFRKEHHPSESLTDAVAANLASVETTVSRRNGYGATITVALVAKKGHHSRAEYFTLTRTLHGGYELQDASLDLK